MWQYEQCGWFTFTWIFPLIFFIVMLVFMFRRGSFMCNGRSREDKIESAREILDRRYASGEINQEEYQRMKKEIK